MKKQVILAGHFSIALPPLDLALLALASLTLAPLALTLALLALSPAQPCKLK